MRGLKGRLVAALASLIVSIAVISLTDSVAFSAVPPTVSTSPPAALPLTTNTDLQPAASASPINVPIVFVSRQIPPDGSNYMPSSNDMPGIGAFSRFVDAAPGKLEILEPDGTIKVLVDGSNPTAASLNLIDVSAPDVSYNGQTIVFAGLPAGTYSASDSAPLAEPGAWRIYTINIDGTGLRQVTFSDQNLNMTQFGNMANALTPYDDTDPAWLPDGRIVFSSTRYPSTAQYSGARTSNLFVVNADGSNLHRITTERNGADCPIVDPVTGKIVYARWWRNDRMAVDNMSTIYYDPSNPSAGYTQNNGLTTNASAVPDGGAPYYNFLNLNFWQAATINPDGTGLQLWRGYYRNFDQNQFYCGTFTPSGALIDNFFPMFNMSEAAGFGGLRLLFRGASSYTPILGVTTSAQTDYVVTNPPSYGIFPGPYAADPAVLPNGQLVISLAQNTNQDYGLYVVNQNGSGLTTLYDNPGTDQLDAHVVEPRPLPPIIPDTVTQVANPLPPPANGPYNQDGTFTFNDLNVYYNAPVDTDQVSGPPIGSASTIRFFLDQQRTGNGSQPNTDWPIQLAQMPVNPDGSVTNPSLPANVPLFEQLHEADGVTVPLTYDQNGPNGVAQVNGMNFAPPGTTQTCVGCHAGHSMLRVPTNPAEAQFTNLAPGAQITVSSTSDPNTNKGLTDRQVMNGGVGAYWRSAPGQTTGQWVQLTFPVPVVVKAVRLYDPVQSSQQNAQCNVVVHGATVQLFSDPAATNLVASQNTNTLAVTGTTVAFNNVQTQSVKVLINNVTGTFNGQAVASLAEIEVIASGTPG